jgi:GTP cyclohydrolase IA
MNDHTQNEDLGPGASDLAAELEGPDSYERRDVYNREKTDALAGHVAQVLQLLGEDPDREGLARTPQRVAKAYQFMTHGYGLDPHLILKSALFNEGHSEMIIVRDIEIYSLCEHHMLPFYGRAHVAYIPNGHIVGLSKIARVVDVFARRLQVQERMTVQIRDVINDVLQPQGVAVVIEAHHLCMMMRGAEKQNSITTTSAMSGVFLDNIHTRAEFLRLIEGR